MSDQQQPRRYTLRRHKGYHLPPDTVVVSRPSRLGNPFKIIVEEGGGYLIVDPTGKVWLSTEDKQEAQAIAVRLHYDAIRDQTFGVPTVDEIIGLLKGRNVGCWCKVHDWCHGDTLLRIANPGIVL